MGAWSRNKVNSSTLNSGNEYELQDRVAKDELNAIINSGLYSQDFAEHLSDTPDTTNVNNIGTPSVEIIDNVVGGKTYKKFKFNNLKGATGGVGELFNPNLLINGDFKVNQREATSVSGANKYACDRWKSGALNSLNTFNNTTKKWTFGISGVSTTGARICIQQVVEDFESLKGKTVTASISFSNLIKEIDSSVVNLVINDGITSTSQQLIDNFASVTKDISQNATTLSVYIQISNNGTNYSITPNYIKLEIGSVSTSFSPKSYGEELADCKRYYQKVRPFFTGFAHNTEKIYGEIALPVKLRVIPIINDIKSSLYGHGNSVYISTPNSFNILELDDNGIYVSLDYTGLQANALYLIETSISNLLLLDAEIY